MLRLLFFCLLLINPSEYGLFVAAYYGYEMISACKVPNITQSNDVHYASAHNYLFQQLYCGLNDARKDDTGVIFYAWHIDTSLGECIAFETNDTMTNLRGTFDDLYDIPPSPTGTTLCKKLEVAKKCASSIQHNQKVEIAIPLLLHETLGKCDIDNVFGFEDQKISIFWTDDYYQPRNLPSFSSNVEFVFFGAAQDFLPQEQWIPNEEMVNAVKHGKSNIVKTLHIRFQQMIGIKKKNIGKDIKSITTTTTFAPSKSTAAKLLNAGFNILPFFQPKPVKVQQLTTIPAPIEIHENFNQSVISDTMPLVVPGKHGKRLDRYHPSQPKKDNSSETATNETYSSSQSDKLTKLPPTEAKEENGFWEAFGESIGYGKYEVWKKENQPLPVEPDPEAGIAYPRESDESAEQPLLKASVSRSSTKAETENPSKGIYDDPFGTPQESTPASPPRHQTSPVTVFPPLYSPAPLTLHSKTSQIDDTHPLQFQTDRDETQTIPELKVPS
uniref:Uncharacterized protein n=1 Tax=Panagrolaimus sp. PS1159 TaxID=55785 RepID=A0AC35GJF3_9BILA